MREGGVVVGDGADEDAGGRAGERGRDGAGVLQRLPGELEYEPLLRVHRGGFTRGYAEEFGVEGVDLREETARERRPVTRSGKVCAIRGWIRYGIAAVPEEVP